MSFILISNQIVNRETIHLNTYICILRETNRFLVVIKYKGKKIRIPICKENIEECYNVAKAKINETLNATVMIEDPKHILKDGDILEITQGQGDLYQLRLRQSSAP